MGVQDLWDYVLEKCPEACKNGLINKDEYNPYPGVNQVKLIVDAEECLSRLYGGYYNDWICGGCWNRQLMFLKELTTCLVASNMIIMPVFNTAFSVDHLKEWHLSQIELKGTLNNIFRQMEHATLAGHWKPPPKIWWVAPSCLELTMRMAMRTLHIPIKCTIHEHRPEVMQLCRTMKFQGIVGESADYLIFQPPRLFSSVSLKLKRNGHIESREFNIDLLLRIIDIHPKRLQLLAALLGNQILTPSDLHGFHCILLEKDPLSDTEISSRAVMEAVLGFIRRLDNPDPTYVGNLIFRGAASLDRKVKGTLIQKLKDSVDYYTKCQFDNISLDVVLPGSYDSFMNKKGLDSEGKETQSNNNSCLDAAANKLNINEINDRELDFFLKFKVSLQIIKEAKERHSDGLMHPWIYQILMTGQIRVPIGVEYESSQNIPLTVDLYRAVRSRAYAVLFDTHDVVADRESRSSPNTLKEKPAITEWVVRKISLLAEKVVPQGFTWTNSESQQTVGIPRCEDLWFRKEFVKQRTQTLLSCLLMESADKLFDPKRIDPQYVVLCCVLRYMIRSKLLSLFELNAFVLQAVHPEMNCHEEIIKKKIPYLNMRAVQLATVFMKGVEHVIFVNDVCGAPIPSHYTAPWNFFDGRLFQYVYHRLEMGENFKQICSNGRSCMLFEKLKRAILDQFPDAVFTSPFGLKETVSTGHRGNESLTSNSASVQGYFAQMVTGLDQKFATSYNFNAAASQLKGNTMKPNFKGRGRGLSSSVSKESGLNVNRATRNHQSNAGLNDYRGGKLQVGGIVVSNWAANMPAANTYTYPKGRGRGFLSAQPASAGQLNNASMYPTPHQNSSIRSLSVFPIMDDPFISRAGRGRGMRANHTSQDQLGLNVNPSLVGLSPFTHGNAPPIKRSYSSVPIHKTKNKNFRKTKTKPNASIQKADEIPSETISDNNNSTEPNGKDSLDETNQNDTVDTTKESAGEPCDNTLPLVDHPEQAAALSQD